VQPGVGRSYEQSIPFAVVKRDPDFALSLARNGEAVEFAAFDEFVAFASDPSGKGDITNAKLVFAGHGDSAPEFGWDDYKNLDVNGAIVVMMRGEPFRENKDDFFIGRELTEHYHMDAKYKLAASKGAAGVIMIYTEQSAGWPWTLPQSGGSGAEQFFLDDKKRETQLRSSAQISEPAAKRLFAKSGHDYDVLTAAAQKTPGTGADLGVTASIKFTGETSRLKSGNVVAKITGREAPEVCIVYTAHWDHVGTNPNIEGDQIFDGALDNATGTAALIEIAQAYKKLPQAPRRSVYFVATTAEEKGLFGAKYFADNSPCAPEKMVAVLNMDSHFPFGSHKAMTVPGYGYSENEAEFAKAAARIGRVLQGDSNKEVGGFYRNDAHPFAQHGIPAIYAVGSPLDSELTEESPILQRSIDTEPTNITSPATNMTPRHGIWRGWSKISGFSSMLVCRWPKATGSRTGALICPIVKRVTE